MWLEADSDVALAFVVRDGAAVVAHPAPDAPLLRRARRLSLVRLRRRDGPRGFYQTTAGWMRAADLRLPTRVYRPPGVGADEAWVDVELGTQTLVVYRGDDPRFVTLVSTGVGEGPFATPRGLHRIRAKLLSATMDNLEHTDVVPYSYESVPYTQYIGRVALHGSFWHDDFGHTHSHGCINLPVSDARTLFALTSPPLPAGADSIAGEGTLVQIR